MEDAFLSLHREFQVLQAVCKKQADLIQKLLSKKENASEMPVSKPIQCSDPGDPTCTEGPFFKLYGKESAYTECSVVDKDDTLINCKPVKQKENPNILLDFEVRFPPNTEQYSFLASENVKREIAVGLQKSQDRPDKRNSTTDLELFIKNYTPQFHVKNSGDDREGAGLDLLIPVKLDQTLNLSNFYEDLCYLQSKDISFGECLAPEAKHYTGVRGPTESSWNPVGLSEECQLGCHFDPSSDVGLSSQICEFCHAIFPAGAATKGEYLRHLTGHLD